MKNKLPKTKNQHYIPQFILKNFTSGKKKHVFVFDKHKDNIFKSNIRNVGSENSFYNYKEGEQSFSLEEKLCSIETLASPIIKDIVKCESLGFLDKEMKAIISLFCAVQVFRVKAARESMKEINNTLKNFIEMSGGRIEDVENFEVMNDDDIKNSSIISLLDADELAPHFDDKIWILLKSPRKSPFITSDNPISLFNSKKREGRGNLGLKVKGIEAHLPLSKTLCLSMVCPSLIEEIDVGYTNIRSSKKFLFLEKTGLLDDVKDILKAVSTGCTRKLKPENVEHLNSLQIANASRFIYSSIDDFYLAKDMIKEEPYLKSPTRMNF